jgi:nicotinamidase-related amidase
LDSPATLSDWVFPWPEFDVDWAGAALLVIDVQNYCCNPRAGITEMLADKHPAIAEYFATRVQSNLIPNIGRLLAAFRDAGREVVYTRHGALLTDGRDLIARRRTRDAEALSTSGRPTMWPVGSFEHQIVDELAPMPGELVLDKNASSPFNGTGIDQLLRNLGVETLVLVGVATDMCVETTGRDAADRGYNVIVAEDATATYYEAHHLASLSALARVYGKVWSTSDILRELDAALGPRVPASAELNASRRDRN